MKPGQRRVLPATAEGRLLDLLETAKAHFRAKVEHPFRIVKCQFGLKKVYYRGILKNDLKLKLLFSLANLWMVPNALAGGYYCPCNQTVYPTIGVCAGECRANLGCFVDICVPSDIPESCPLIIQKLRNAEKLWSIYRDTPTEGKARAEYDAEIDNKIMEGKTGRQVSTPMAFDRSDAMFGIWAMVKLKRLPQMHDKDWVEVNPQEEDLEKRKVWVKILEGDGARAPYYDTVLNFYKEDYGDYAGKEYFDASVEHEMSHMERYSTNPDLYDSTVEEYRQDELAAYETLVQKLREALRRLDCQAK